MTTCSGFPIGIIVSLGKFHVHGAAATIASEQCFCAARRAALRTEVKDSSTKGEAQNRASPNESQLALPRSNHFRARNVSGVVLLHMQHDDINGIREEFRDWNVCSFELGGVEVAPNRSGAVNTNVLPPKGAFGSP